MSRIDIARLRKNEGLSQRKLAEMLEIRPSFLSAIENGRSRLPEDKVEKIKTLFGTEIIEEYMYEECEENVVPPHTHLHDETDSLTQLLDKFHTLAHQRHNQPNDKVMELVTRLDKMSERNDRLSGKIDDLRDLVDQLRQENLRLKELLIKNQIQY